MGLADLLKDYDKESVEQFVSYVNDLKEKKKWDAKTQTYEIVNKWALKRPDSFFADCFKKVASTGLKFDGVHVIIQERGVGYDYVAYKNKMLLAYPESQLDVGLVYKGDTFDIKKENGKIEYHHTVSNPFGHNDNDIIGGYMVVKNKRGEFFTSLSLDEIQKCRAVAKTDTIWKMWFSDMCQKTVIKKAVKLHFDDVFCEMEKEDNQNYDLDKPLKEETKDKALELFKEQVKNRKDKDELIEKFEQLDLEGRRNMYKSILDETKGKKQ